LSLPTAKRQLRLHTSIGATTCLVVDGGLPGETPLFRPLRFEETGDDRVWRALSMSRGDLHVLDSTNPHKGVSHVPPTFSPSTTPTHAPPPFTRLPRHSSVNLMGMDDVLHSTRLCHLLKKAELHQKKQFSRGSTRHIFSSSKYVRLGATPNRASKGNSCSSQNCTLPLNVWQDICSMMASYEKLYRAYVPTEEIRRIAVGKRVIGFPSLGEFDSHPRSSDPKCNIFASLAFSAQSHANLHVDTDMCQGLVVMHEPHVQYVYRQEPLAYFCFPCLGVAVPLRPGDVIVFNPREPHCLSSQLRPEKQCYAVGMYLKTAIVGLNDNSLPLTPAQERLYFDI
jgi:hypothetical protein